MRIATMIAAAAALSTLAGAALAQPTPPTPEERAAAFDKADTNKDGKLDKAEFVTTLPEQAKGFADQIWERRDTNKDGFISKEENAAPMGRRGG